MFGRYFFLSLKMLYLILSVHLSDVLKKEIEAGHRQPIQASLCVPSYGCSSKPTRLDFSPTRSFYRGSLCMENLPVPVYDPHPVLFQPQSVEREETTVNKKALINLRALALRTFMQELTP
jgi:hypothetical protein